MSDAKPYAPACERNRDPILAVLREQLADAERVLEIGSGTGQHAVHFAAAMPWLEWQTSDVGAQLPGISAWLAEAALPNTPPPMALDVQETAGSFAGTDLSIDSAQHGIYHGFDAVFTANTLHIVSWAAVGDFFRVVRRALQPRESTSVGTRGNAHRRQKQAATASLIVYGPFNYDGAFTSDSNRDFDGWLKARDPQSGIRDFEAVDRLAQSIGLHNVADIRMPANNRCLVWRRELPLS